MVYCELANHSCTQWYGLYRDKNPTWFSAFAVFIFGARGSRVILQCVYTVQSGFPRNLQYLKICTGSYPAGLNFRLWSLSFEEEKWFCCVLYLIKCSKKNCHRHRLSSWANFCFHFSYRKTLPRWNGLLYCTDLVSPRLLLLAGISWLAGAGPIWILFYGVAVLRTVCWIIVRAPEAGDLGIFRSTGKCSLFLWLFPRFKMCCRSWVGLPGVTGCMVLAQKSLNVLRQLLSFPSLLLKAPWSSQWGVHWQLQEQPGSSRAEIWGKQVWKSQPQAWCS